VTSERSCVVWIYLPGGGGPVACGALTVDQVGRNLRAEFTYGPRYLERPDAMAIDPLNLPVRQATFTAEHLFGAFRDAAPDSWGRKVLEMRHAALRHNEFGELPELEYLLRSAGDRVGALAFTESPATPPTLHTRTADRHHPIHYLSAKTLLRQHGETEVGSYPAFADELRRWSDRPVDDCHELFGRMLFNIATGNRDDHAKNHGVLHAGGRTYRLAPAFDLVPIPQVATTSRQAMIVGLHGQDSNLANALTAAAHFMLSADDARAIARRVAKVVSEWRRYFAAASVSDADMTRVESCFERARISC